MNSARHITILGDGGWGTTLAILLCNKGFDITIWSAFAQYADYLNTERVNTKFLPGVTIPKKINITNDLHTALINAQLVVLAIPSQYMRSVINKIERQSLKDKIFVSVSKGIENETLMRVSEIVHDCLGKVNFAVLSGPTISYEVIREFPTAAVSSSFSNGVALAVQNIFMTERFRVYTNSDQIGVELGGAVKNIIAIAAGISDGLGFGANAKATIMDRGIIEMARLGIAMGAKRETFLGLSGVGDLITTCMSSHSRNRCFGEAVGKGRKVEEILSSTEMVVEGVTTTKSICQLSKKYDVEMPIANEIFAIVFDKKKPLDALKSLMSRSAKPEMEEDTL